MKKILAVVLGILILTGGLIGCKPKEEPDPHEGLYGTYKVVSLYVSSGGGSTRYTVDLISNVTPKEVNDFIQKEIIGKAGDIITITKNKIKFSGGSIEKEFDYTFEYSDWIFFDDALVNGEYFPFDKVRYDEFSSYTPTKYQLFTRRWIDIGEKSYEIDFYYSRQN